MPSARGIVRLRLADALDREGRAPMADSEGVSVKNDDAATLWNCCIQIDRTSKAVNFILAFRSCRSVRKVGGMFKS